MPLKVPTCVLSKIKLKKSMCLNLEFWAVLAHVKIPRDKYTSKSEVKCFQGKNRIKLSLVNE